MSYINTYLVTLYGMSETAAANLGGIRYLMQGVGGIIGGFLADKIRSRLFWIYLVKKLEKTREKKEEQR